MSMNIKIRKPPPFPEVYRGKLNEDQLSVVMGLSHIDDPAVAEACWMHFVNGAPVNDICKLWQAVKRPKLIRNIKKVMVLIGTIDLYNEYGKYS